MFESIQFLSHDLSYTEKLYLARLLNREQFEISDICYEGIDHKRCTKEKCVCSCHLYKI